MKFCLIRRLFDWTTIVGSWGGDLIYAKRSNILFEIAIAPHLISNINQALFYTHLTWRWGSIHLGKPPDKESTTSHFQFPFDVNASFKSGKGVSGKLGLTSLVGQQATLLLKWSGQCHCYDIGNLLWSHYSTVQFNTAILMPQRQSQIYTNVKPIDV